VGGTYWATFFPALVVLGLGMAITVAPLTTTVMNSVATSHAGAASGINNAASRVAGVLAVALFGVVIVPVFDRSLHDRLGGADAAPALIEAIDAQRNKLAAIALPENIDPRNRAAAERAIGEAFVSGFRWVMLVSSVLALAGALGAWVLIGSSLAPGSAAP